MKSKTVVENYNLSTGNLCQLLKIEKELIPNYFLLIFPKEQGQPAPPEVSEMLTIGIKCAQKVSLEILGDQEALLVIYSGYSSRRERGWHIHIILLGSRWREAWLYLMLAEKNILQALKIREDDAPNL
jgi:hypothetical protein